MMSLYAVCMDVTRHKQDELYAASGEIIRKIQEHIEPVPELKKEEEKLMIDYSDKL